jgi:sugar fermentation stimulation protein A
MVCEKSFGIKIGKIGHVRIEKGVYLYTGSALGRGGTSLEGRISRHYRRKKRVKWHVDFLTVRPEVIIKRAICLQSSERFECRINQKIMTKLAAKPLAPHAGATDCNCDGHLLSINFADGSKGVLNRLEQIYSWFGTPILL